MTFFIDEGIKENTIYPLPEDVLLQMSAKVFTLFFFSDMVEHKNQEVVQHQLPEVIQADLPDLPQ